MEISPRLDGVDGTFNTDTGQLKCVPYPKYAEVLLCFAERANIPFARIKLHSEDRYQTALAVLPDAVQLGDEITKRWNEYPALQERERRCPTMQEGESRALLRGLQECARLLGLGHEASPAEVVDALREKLAHQVAKK
ncbi:hypothetical protein EFK68_02770 [Pseudomonas aeruginosa]|uniref:hypothetical protein n=1 Tax=Pseudomonas aeruginosa TaxID=287 RepID=UPI000F6B1ADD|nr:hypothetical protein [Pseudomonas aeruginosa]MDS9915003.1 hypothetical protein [Pseudomonas aeruginosa]RNF58332.1 hypothetical protein EFK68_02770 [Pseudomonas aeruginosa]